MRKKRRRGSLVIYCTHAGSAHRFKLCDACLTNHDPSLSLLSLSLFVSRSTRWDRVASLVTHGEYHYAREQPGHHDSEGNLFTQVELEVGN